MKRPFIVFAFLLLSISVHAQTKDQLKAEARVKSASDTLATFSKLLGNDSIAVGLAKKAKAIAVFDIVLTDGLLDKEIRGSGVLSFNQNGTWTVPTFMSCRGIRMEWGRSIFRPKQRVTAIFLFMDDTSFSLIQGWKKRGPGVKGDRIALGPIVGGKGAETVEANASVIYYSFEGEQLSGEEFPITGVGSVLKMNHDNDLNKKIFGRKFGEANHAPEEASVTLEGLKNLRKTINEQFGAGAK